MPVEPRLPTSPAPRRLLMVAPLLAALALGGCSRGTGLREFATNLRDRVAGDAAAAAAERVLRPSPAETGGGGGGRPRPKAAQPGQPGQPGQSGDQGASGDNSTGPGGTATGSADANQPTKAPSPPVIYYYPTTPTPSAPSQ